MAHNSFYSMNRDMGPTRCPVVNLSRMRCEVEGKCGGSPGERGVAEAAMCAVVKSLWMHAHRLDHALLLTTPKMRPEAFPTMCRMLPKGLWKPWRE